MGINHSVPIALPFSVPFQFYLCHLEYGGPRLEQQTPAGADYGLISSFSQLEVLGFQVSVQETKGLVSIASDPVNMGLP